VDTDAPHCISTKLHSSSLPGHSKSQFFSYFSRRSQRASYHLAYRNLNVTKRDGVRRNNVTHVNPIFSWPREFTRGWNFTVSHASTRASLTLEIIHIQANALAMTIFVNEAFWTNVAIVAILFASANEFLISNRVLSDACVHYEM
jgi:hypothetical protein